LAALAMTVGLAFGLVGLERVLSPFAGLGLAIAIAAIHYGRRDLLVWAALLIIAAAGTLTGLLAERRAEGDCRNRWKSGREVRITGVAAGFLPAGTRGSIRLRPQGGADEGGCRWTGPVRVWTEGPVVPGAVYSVRGVWQPARSPGRTPRPPERRGWVSAYSISLAEGAAFRSHPFLTARGVLAERLWRTYPRRWAPMAQALVLGQRETLGRDVSQRIARAGLAHLLAISGLHVGMLAAALFAFARLVRLPSARAHLATVVATWAYVLLIGAPASAVRAALMVFLWALTRLAGRASSAFDVLGLAAVLLLLVRPWSVFEPGFQLSFAGAAAVGYAFRETRGASALRGRPAFVKAIVASLVTSTAAVLLTAPITAVHFGRVTPAAILGNLAAIPLLALAMPALFASAVFSAWPGLASWPAGGAIVLLHGIDLVARLLSSVRWASLTMAPPGLLPTLAYFVVLVLGAHALHGAWQRRRFILALGLLAAVAIAWPPLKARLGPNTLSVYVLDVGQGDAIAISTPQHHWLLVDAGPKVRSFDAGERRVLPFLRERGASRLEAWLASHPDLDHVGGAPAIFDAIDVERVIGSGYVTGQVGQVAVLRWLVERDKPWVHARAGSRLIMDEVELLFLHPGDEYGSEMPPPNELSLVFLLTYGKFRMLFTGDVSGSVEDRLGREHGERLRVQVLKVSHHGSATSTSSRFLETVQPELAVISAGRGNRYGHPSQMVLWRLAREGAEVRRTDHDGTVVIEAWPDGSWQVHTAAAGF
jgi:competence protein ComEC